MSNLNKRINAFDDTASYESYMAGEIGYPNIAYIRASGNFEKVAGSAWPDFRISLQTVWDDGSYKVWASSAATPPDMFMDESEFGGEKNFYEIAVTSMGFDVTDTKITKFACGWDNDTMSGSKFFDYISLSGGTNLLKCNYMFTAPSTDSGGEDLTSPVTTVYVNDFTPINATTFQNCFSYVTIDGNVNMMVPSGSSVSFENMFQNVKFSHPSDCTKLNFNPGNGAINNMFVYCSQWESGWGLDFSEWDLSQRTSPSEKINLFFSTENYLTRMEFGENFWKAPSHKYNFKNATVWTPTKADGSTVFVTQLPNIALQAETGTIRLSSTTYGKLSQSDLTAASDKGWTITTT
jgi:hypothetical protein